MWLEARRSGTSEFFALADGRARGTVEDLAAALGFDPAGGLRIDGHWASASSPLAETTLVNGSIVDQPSTRPAAPTAPPGAFADVEVVVVGGPDAGQRRCLAETDAVVIGRDPGVDLRIDNPSVSAVHATIRRSDGRITVEDAGSHNGTWLIEDGPGGPEVAVDGIVEVQRSCELRLGSTRIAIVSEGRVDRPLGVDPVHADDGGRVLMNRPPRAALPAEPTPVRLPAMRPDRPNPFFSPIALVAPIVFGAVMVLALGSWRFAIFAVLSPLMLLSGWITNRRRVAAQRRSDDETWDESFDRLGVELAAAVIAERTRRRVLAPDPAEVHRRVEQPSTRLWERRLGHEDALIVGIGKGAAAWTPPVEALGRGVEPDESTAELLAAHREIEAVPLLADLRDGPIGVVGEPAVGEALMRSLVLQLCTLHGPADLSVMVVAQPGRFADWAWARWLPHLQSPDGGVRLLAPEAAADAASALLETVEDSTRTWVVVVDDVSLVHERGSALRELLTHSPSVVGIVAAERSDQLPASVVTVAEVASVQGTLTVSTPGQSDSGLDHGVVDAVGVEVATRTARRMARWEDPESAIDGGGLPALVEAADIHGPIPTVEAVQMAWARGGGGRLDAVIGVSADGPAVIDLVSDGPHALVAGTTGAGKSELLRTWLLGMAHRHGPDDLVAVLIDYKGGAAFDALKALPHVVGMVTDLDPHLAERALRSMEAELTHRERRLAAAGVSDLAGHREAGSPDGPIPRLVVMIDEFATLRAELPDFVASLVGIAQRGRSLGVHLVLATQRPAGAVDANIRANTNLRIALRVQNDADSHDVLEDARAAALPREAPGRAWVRRGTGDLAAVQTAWVSVAPVAPLAGGVTVVPLSPVGTAPPPAPERPRVDGPSTLAATVEVMVAAAAGRSAPRRPWLPDLEPVLGPDVFDELATTEGAPVPLAVGDDPDNQRRVVLGWDPTAGPMVVVGALGSGVTTLLVSTAIRLAHGVNGRAVWVFAADHAAGGLESLRGRAHVGCVLDPMDVESHGRLLDVLEDLLVERSGTAASSTEPLVVLLVDGIQGFTEVLDAGPGGANADRFARIVRDGPAVGIVCVAGANRPAEFPKALLAGARARFVLELTDAMDLSALGIRRRTLPSARPGRALVGADGIVAQIVDQRRLAGPAEPGPLPPTVEPLAASIASDVVGPARSEAGALIVPVGIDERLRRPATITLRAGEHALVAGPPGSGRTTALRTMADKLRSMDPDLVLVALVPGGVGPLVAVGASGPFDAGGGLEVVGPLLRQAVGDGRTWVVFVDDAERLDGERAFEDVLRAAPPNLHLVAAIRSNSNRSDWGRWTRTVRASGVGVLLTPDPAVDGELLGVRLPRSAPERTPGRGYVVHAGTSVLAQLAH